MQEKRGNDKGDDPSEPGQDESVSGVEDETPGTEDQTGADDSPKTNNPTSEPIDIRSKEGSEIKKNKPTNGESIILDAHKEKGLELSQEAQKQEDKRKDNDQDTN